ncbi:hypothetical protein WJX73_008523 [Symbiochloris irregularis]|uniref:Uncharacterized protein n=1 Tax=Symbiochloris irregularis TaxID=706552 RepID=A0AAW1NWX9_9CHLO
MTCESYSIVRTTLAKSPLSEGGALVTSPLQQAWWGQVEVVIVGDDCALPHTGPTMRRGIAGVILALKVAGAAAAAGCTLEEVAEEARQAAAAICSCGVAASVCTLPGHKPSTRLRGGEVEIGLGIHGEPGAATDSMQPADDLVHLVIDKILAQNTGFSTVQAGDEAVLLVNSMGATPPIELYLLANSAVSYLATAKKVTVVRTFVGTFCTSLDMAGFSMSLQSLTQQRLERLDAPAQAPGWPSVSAVHQPGKQKYPAKLKAEPVSGSRKDIEAELSAQGSSIKRALQAACEALIAAAEDLDSLDEKAGDGDCGTTLRRGAEAALAEAKEDRVPWNSAVGAAQAIASAARSMGGTSGALYNIFLTAAAASLAEAGTAASLDDSGHGSPARWAAAFSSGVEAMQRYGGARPGDRTMLDALVPASLAMQEGVQSGQEGREVLRSAVQAAQVGGRRTSSMQAGAGRAAYVPAKALQGVEDPGALAVGIWLSAMETALFGSSA